MTTDKGVVPMRNRIAFPCLLTVCLFAFASGLLGQNQAAFKPGAKVFVSPMPDGFDTYLKAALEKKKVPVTIVTSKDAADFEITGSSETQKAGTAKKLIRLDWHSDEEASISITNLKSSEIVFAYSVNKQSSAHGKQSTAEACATHIKDQMGKKK
jgi:hypothetical protein